MRHRASALLFVAVFFGVSACGSSHPAASHPARSVPSRNGSYAWKPIPGGPSLVCSAGYGRVLIDWAGRPYYCKLPAPAHHQPYGGIDFLGPSTYAAGPVPLKAHQLHLHINFTGPRHDVVLRVDFGDGTHWQRTFDLRGLRHGASGVDVVHTYAPTPHAFLLVTLRDKAGYLGVEGYGPFGAPLSEPHTRYCTYISDGKGGTLNATKSLTCAQAEGLYAHYVAAYPHGTPPGYHCHAYGMPPYGSDSSVESCTSGARAFVFVSNQ